MKLVKIPVTFTLRSNRILALCKRTPPCVPKCGRACVCGGKNTLHVPAPATRLRSVVVPVNPGTRVMYLVNLVSVPQDPDAALTNKVLPEQEGSPLTRVLLLAARNKKEGDEDEDRFLAGDYLIPFSGELEATWNIDKSSACTRR